MLMKVFNKGQVVIPGDIRKSFGIHIGEMLNVEFNEKKKCIELSKAVYHAKELAGSLSEYAKAKPFPSNEDISESLTKGMSSHEK